MSLLRVARNYARALADSLPDDAAIRRLEGEIRQLATAFAADDEVQRFLAGPRIPAERKAAVAEQALAAAGASPELRRFVRLLIDRQRVSLLAEIAGEFSAVATERLGIVDAEVVSALPLSDDLQDRARAGLRRLTGREVRARFQVDRSVLGGLRARVGSTIYDGSLRGRLDRLRARFAGK